MKQGKHQTRWRRRWRKVVHGGTTRMLKPVPTPVPEGAGPVADEMPGLPISSTDNSGVLRSDKTSHLPTALAEASEHDENGQKSWLPGSLVMTISLVAILFIAIITWFISQMPSK